MDEEVIQQIRQNEGNLECREDLTGLGMFTTQHDSICLPSYVQGSWDGF